MERIDLLWDAWEDCLCKAELRAEFDRLTAENEKLEKSRQAYIKILDETMLENERLNEIIKNQSSLINNMGERGAKMQSWLDRISGELLRSKEWANHIPDNTPLPYPAYNALHYVYAYLDSQKPRSTLRRGQMVMCIPLRKESSMGIKEQLIRVCCDYCTVFGCEGEHCPDYWAMERVFAEFDRLTVRNVNLQTCLDTICEPIRTDGDIDYIKRTVIPLLYEQCKTISAQTLERVLAYLDSQKKPRPADSHKKPNHVHSDDSSVFWEGKTKDCPVCNPQKPSEKPSCCHRPNLGGDCPICNPKPLHPDRFCTGCTEETFGKMYATVSGDSDVKLPPGLEKIWVCEECPEYLSRNPKPKYKNTSSCSFADMPSAGIWQNRAESDDELMGIKPKCEHKNGGISYYSEGALKQWCADCKEWVEKSLTQCPECIWGQKRCEFTAVEGAYCKYVVYERCPRCKGEGVI